MSEAASWLGAGLGVQAASWLGAQQAQAWALGLARQADTRREGRAWGARAGAAGSWARRRGAQLAPGLAKQAGAQGRGARASAGRVGVGAAGAQAGRWA